MRIIDRYLLREFLIPLMYCLDAFALLLVVVDLFGSLDDFIKYHAAVGEVVRYYLIVLPELLVQTVPMALLLGLLFCLANLGKHNELVALRAGGVSVGRIALPLLAVGVAAAVIVLVVNVFLVPGARAHSRSLMQAIKGHGSENVIENLFYTNHQESRDWYARRFSSATGVFENPEVHELDAQGRPRRDIYAATAYWAEGQWVFTDASVQTYDYPPGMPARASMVQISRTNFPSITDRPQLVVAENKRIEEMTPQELRRAIRSHRRAGRDAQSATLRTELHHRYAFPVTCLMVIWFGIPLGINIRRSGALRSVGIALLLITVYHFGTNIALALGGGNHIPPPVAAWASNAIFAAIGAGLMWRAR